MKKSVRDFIASMKDAGVQVTEFSSQEVKRYKEEWFNKYVPVDINYRHYRKQLLGRHGHLWGALDSKELCSVSGNEAKIAFDLQSKAGAVLLSMEKVYGAGSDDPGRYTAYLIGNASKIGSEEIDSLVEPLNEGTPLDLILTDIILTDVNFSWSYAVTFFGDIGPYFYGTSLAKTTSTTESEKTKDEPYQLIYSLREAGLLIIELSFRESDEHKEEWFRRFIPTGREKEAMDSYCLDDYGYLWHAFSYGIIDCIEGDDAKAAFDEQHKCSAILRDNHLEATFFIRDASRITAMDIDKLCDVTVTDIDFNWTYTKTHEYGWLGPYFYKR